MKKFLESKLATVIGLLIIWIICILIESCAGNRCTSNPFLDVSKYIGKWECDSMTVIEITKDSIYISDLQTDECELFSYDGAVTNSSYDILTLTDELGYREDIRVHTRKNKLSLIYLDYEPTKTYIFTKIK